ncbi:hypothetical protein HYW18_02175 [Candidatus Uhrbacteria bacterium]|nr:hypothetical protein [Candidatus Uhrbacteria bacterium]
MAHPHQSLLLEFDLAVKKLPPTLPDLAKQAKAQVAKFRADESITEETVLEALAELGRKEYPHRHALLDLHGTYGEGMEAALVLDHVDAKVAEKLRPMLKDGVTIEEVMASGWFQEKLSPEERYQVEDGMLLARYKMEQEDKGIVKNHVKEYDERVAHWEAEAKSIEALIEELETLAGKDKRYAEEINNQVRTFRTGWSVTERDPDPTDVKAAVDYWKDVLGEM